MYLASFFTKPQNKRVSVLLIITRQIYGRLDTNLKYSLRLKPNLSIKIPSPSALSPVYSLFLVVADATRIVTSSSSGWAGRVSGLGAGGSGLLYPGEEGEPENPIVVFPI